MEAITEGSSRATMAIMAFGQAEVDNSWGQAETVTLVHPYPTIQSD